MTAEHPARDPSPAPASTAAPSTAASSTARADTPAAASAPAPAPAAGSIYDLGYQRYEGRRLGRPHAIRALYVHSLKGAFGIGRGGRAKVAPIGLLALAIVPAVVAIGFQAFFGRAGAVGRQIEAPIRFDTYYPYVQTLVMLFVAAQAPELLGRDQRYHVLSLYFSRALRRSDYAIAKAAALVSAILIVVLTPQAIIFLGLTLAGRDVVAALGESLRSAPAIVVEGTAVALLLGAVGLAIAAYTPRRAYASATIIGAFIVPPIAAAIIGQAAHGELARYVVLLSPGDVLEGLNAWVFGRLPTNSTVARADLPGPLFLAVVVVATTLLLGVVLRRYRRIAA